MTAIKWVSRLMLLSALGTASNAWADTDLVDNKTHETIGAGATFQSATPPDSAISHLGVTKMDALSAATAAALAPVSIAFPDAGVEVTTSAADLADLSGVAHLDHVEGVPSPWHGAETQVTQIDFPAISQRVAQEAAPSPWRVEFRPYLEVPFSVNGRLLFESVLDLGDIDITVAGTDIESFTITPSPPIAGAVTALSQSELAALAAARSTLGGTALPGNPTSGSRTVQLSQIRGIDLSSVFLLGGELEIWYNDFAFVIDGFYANLGSRLLFGRSGSNNTSQSVLELGVDYTRIGAALGWRMGRFPLTSREDVPAAAVFPAITVDVFGGARYTSYGFDFVSTNAQLTYRANPRWLEPIVQTRAEVLFDPRTKLTLNGYVGGFGLGNSPNFSWGGAAGLDWRFLPNVSIRPSYKFVSVDWDGDEGIVDLTTHSLWLGFTVYFN